MTQKDPVCNMMIDEKIDEKKAQHTSEINGQKIYLCSAHCKSQFDRYCGWILAKLDAVVWVFVNPSCILTLGFFIVKIDYYLLKKPTINSSCDKSLVNLSHLWFEGINQEWSETWLEPSVYPIPKFLSHDLASGKTRAAGDSRVTLMDKIKWVWAILRPGEFGPINY